MTIEPVRVAEPTAPITPEKASKTKAGGEKRGDRLAAWSGFSLVLGLAGDMATPLGKYSLWLAIAGVAGFLLCFLMRRVGFARRAMFHTGIFAAVMTAIVVLQQLAPPKKDADERGFAAAFVPVIASIQTKVLPLPENQRMLLQFRDAIASGSDGDRVATARELYQGVEDSAIRRGMIEAMMQSDNPALQQSAILMRLAERNYESLSLVPVKRDASDVLTRRLLSYAFRTRQVNVDSGGLELLGDGFTSNGTVSRQGITMQLYIDVAPDVPRKLMLVELTPDTEMRLTGMARLDSGEAVAVELPLF